METNEGGNENEKGKDRQEGSNCGIGRRSCKMQDSVVHPAVNVRRLIIDKLARGAVVACMRVMARLAFKFSESGRAWG